MMKYILSLLFLLINSIAALSQSLNHIGLFPTIDHSGKISRKWDYSLYYFGTLHLYNDEVNGIKEPSELFVFYSEQALTYKFNQNLSFTGSYVYERQHPLESNYRNEHRFYLQSAYKYNLGKTMVKHRLRFDGRFVADRVTSKAPFTHRLRYLTGISTPISKTGKTYLSAYNEFFFNTYKGTTVLYSENWASAAIGVKVSKSSSIETGPLYIFWVNDKPHTLNSFYYLQLTWVSLLDFSK